MKPKNNPAVEELARKVEELSRFIETSRNLPPLSIEQVQAHVDSHGRDVRAARKNIAGMVGPVAPHERRIGDDSHITGRVGGLGKPNLWRAKRAWIDDEDYVNRIRYNQPITRPGRPVNARGFSTLYFSFEAIDKAQIELGITNAQGRKVSPDEHVKYVERVEAVGEYIDALRKDAPISPDDFVQYQEREGAVASGPGSALSACIFTNIRGTTQIRADLFAKIAEHENVECEPSIELHLGLQTELMRKLRSRLNISEETDPAGIAPLVLRGAEAHELAQLLGKTLGWRDKRTIVEKQKRQIDSMGVRFDPGKSGTVQNRIIGELPADIPHEGRIRIVQGLCEEFEQRDLPFVAVIHAPGPENNDRNWHFHLVYHDRPIAIFDGTADTHVRYGDVNGGIPDRKTAAMRRHLDDPAVQSQVGKWDFEVEAIWFKKRQRKVSYPYRQRKDRDVTRDSFVPGLRSKLCDLTNAEFERAGLIQRVDPLSHNEAKRAQKPGKKLGSALFNLEMSGVPTDIGSDNEKLQWKARLEQLELERQLIPQRSYVTEDETHRIVAKNPNQDRRWALFNEIAHRRREIADLRHLGRHARELIDRLISRPKAVAERNQNLLIAAAGRKKPNSNAIAAFDRQASHAQAHIQAMTLLAGDLFQIGRDAEREIAAIEKRLRAVETEAGIRTDYEFDCDIAQPAPPLVCQVTEGSCVGELDAATPVKVTARAPAIADDVLNLVPDAAPLPEPMPLAQAPASEPPAAPPSVSTTADKIAVSAPPPVVPTQVTALQGAVVKSSPASHARRKRISKQINTIVNHDVPFELVEETTGTLPIRVALIDPSVANKHGLPSRIEAREEHEQRRLIGIADARKAASIFQRVFEDPEAPIWSSAKTNTPSDPSHSSSKQNALGSPELAAAATPVSRPAEPAHLHQPQTQPQSTPIVAKTEGAQQASEAVSNKLPAQSPSSQAGVDESSPVPPSKKADPPQPILPVSPPSLEPAEDILEVINSLSWDDTKDRGPVKAEPEASEAKQDINISAPQLSSSQALTGRQTQLSAEKVEATISQVTAKIVDELMRERAALRAKAAQAQPAPTGHAKAANNQPVLDPQKDALRRTQAKVMQDLRDCRILVSLDQYGHVRINDNRTKCSAMAAWEVDPQVQQELERQLKYQNRQLRDLSLDILQGNLHLNGQSQIPGYAGQPNSEASQLLADWGHNPTVARGLRYLAERPYQVPQREIPETVDIFTAVLSGSDEARAKVSHRHHAYRVALGVETGSSGDALAASKAQERSQSDPAKQVQSSKALKPEASSDRAAEAPQIGRRPLDPGRQVEVQPAGVISPD